MMLPVVICAIAIAGLIAVIVWPFGQEARPQRDDSQGGFHGWV